MQKVRRRPKRTPFDRRRAFRTIVILFGAACLLWFIMAVTGAGVFGSTNPGLALKFSRNNAKALATAAHRRVFTGRPHSLVEAEKLAKSALDRDPTVETAAQTLALVAVGRRDIEKAEKLFSYTEALSRRDLATQLWLIEKNVDRNDINGALRHFDIALRTNRKASDLLFPVLISASVDEAIAGPLNRLVLKRPVWWRPFIWAMIRQAKDTSSLINVTRDLLDPQASEDRELLVAILDRLQRDGDFQRAWALYGNLAGQSISGTSTLVDGEFSHDPAYPPFEWQFSQDSDLLPERAPKAGSKDDFALYFPALGSTRGVVAKQLIRLESGQYDFKAEVGEVSADPFLRPYVSLICAGEPSRQIAHIDFPAAPVEGMEMRAVLTVPQTTNCSTQTLNINARGSIDGRGDLSWIDSISLTRM